MLTSSARPRHAVAIADDALKAAIVLTDRFVPERARPDKAIDVLDEACAHAQATARVSPELDRLIRERRKVDALIRRGLTHERHETVEEDPLQIGEMMERLGRELEALLGSPGRTRTVPEGREKAATAVEPSLTDQRAELDRLLREELERQGIVVSGTDVARVVAAAVGKGIEWTG